MPDDRNLRPAKTAELACKRDRVAVAALDRLTRDVSAPNTPFAPETAWASPDAAKVVTDITVA